MITDSNTLNWLCDNRSINLGLNHEEHALLNKTLGVSTGDTLWLSRRHKTPEVCICTIYGALVFMSIGGIHSTGSPSGTNI
jgi:hypothetical protein